MKTSLIIAIALIFGLIILALAEIDAIVIAGKILLATMIISLIVYAIVKTWQARGWKVGTCLMAVIAIGLMMTIFNAKFLFNRPQGPQRTVKIFVNKEIAYSKDLAMFDGRTGKAIVYYSRDSNGDYHLFASSGYDSIRGVKLSAMTTKVKAGMEKRVATCKASQKKAATVFSQVCLNFYNGNPGSMGAFLSASQGNYGPIPYESFTLVIQVGEKEKKIAITNGQYRKKMPEGDYKIKAIMDGQETGWCTMSVFGRQSVRNYNLIPDESGFPKIEEITESQ